MFDVVLTFHVFVNGHLVNRSIYKRWKLEIHSFSLTSAALDIIKWTAVFNFPLDGIKKVYNVWREIPGHLNAVLTFDLWLGSYNKQTSVLYVSQNHIYWCKLWDCTVCTQNVHRKNVEDCLLYNFSVKKTCTETKKETR